VNEVCAICKPGCARVREEEGRRNGLMAVSPGAPAMAGVVR
jgi:hypothetical protein